MVHLHEQVQLDILRLIKMYYLSSQALLHLANFQAPIGIWDMEYAENLEGMFRYSAFNQPIGNWNVGRVTNLFAFISEAESFAQDLSRWCVTNITVMPGGWDWRNLMTPELSPVWGTCPNGI